MLGFFVHFIASLISSIVHFFFDIIGFLFEIIRSLIGFIIGLLVGHGVQWGGYEQSQAPTKHISFV